MKSWRTVGDREGMDERVGGGEERTKIVGKRERLDEGTVTGDRCLKIARGDRASGRRIPMEDNEGLMVYTER